MSESGSSLLKWIGAIAATVIGGYLLWWLTKEKKEIETTPDKTPHVKIASCNFKQIFLRPGDKDTAIAEIFNDGDGVAANCFIEWIIEAGYHQDKSESFSLEPGEKKAIMVVSKAPYVIGKNNTYVYLVYENKRIDSSYKGIFVVKNPDVWKNK
jgi:hypothetical protein